MSRFPRQSRAEQSSDDKSNADGGGGVIILPENAVVLDTSLVGAFVPSDGDGDNKRDDDGGDIAAADDATPQQEAAVEALRKARSEAEIMAENGVNGAFCFSVYEAKAPLFVPRTVEFVRSLWAFPSLRDVLANEIRQGCPPPGVPLRVNNEPKSLVIPFAIHENLDDFLRSFIDPPRGGRGRASDTATTEPAASSAPAAGGWIEQALAQLRGKPGAIFTRTVTCDGSALVRAMSRGTGDQAVECKYAAPLAIFIGTHANTSPLTVYASLYTESSSMDEKRRNWIRQNNVAPGTTAVLGFPLYANRPHTTGKPIEAYHIPMKHWCSPSWHWQCVIPTLEEAKSIDSPTHTDTTIRQAGPWSAFTVQDTALQSAAMYIILANFAAFRHQLLEEKQISTEVAYGDMFEQDTATGCVVRVPKNKIKGALRKIEEACERSQTIMNCSRFHLVLSVPSQSLLAAIEYFSRTRALVTTSAREVDLVFEVHLNLLSASYRPNHQCYMHESQVERIRKTVDTQMKELGDGGGGRHAAAGGTGSSADGNADADGVQVHIIQG